MKADGRVRVPVALAILCATLLMLASGLIWSLASIRPHTTGKQVSLDVAGRLAAERKIRSATFDDYDARALLRSAEGRTVWVAYPAAGPYVSSLIDATVKGGATVSIDQQWGKRIVALLAQFVLPMLLLANLFGVFVLLARGGGSQVKELFAFSRIGARRASHQAATGGFSDVAGLEEAMTELAEVRDYLADPARFAALGALPPKGVLLFGPPGCGKTLLARALAAEASVPFYPLSGSEFVESLVGVGAARVRDLFRLARSNAPAIVFVDELDAAGRRRGAGIGGGHDEREQTLNEMLVQMDGFASSLGVVVVAATNRPDILDPALLRPGRFDRHVMVEAPDVRGRQDILGLHLSRRPRHAEVDLAVIAQATPGFTGADLASVANEAALQAVRRGAGAIAMEDLSEAVLRVQYGPKRRGRLLTREELSRLAWHEAGHSVVAHALSFPGRVRRVSIVARGHSAGRCDVSRADRLFLTRGELHDELAVTVGGVAAEELDTGEPSTAAADDVERATSIAREMAGRLGMSSTVGRVRVLGRDEEVFLGRDYAASQNASARTLERVDEAVRDLVDSAHERATAILRDRRATLEAIAGELIEKESLEEFELEALLAPGPRPAPARGRSRTEP